MEEEVKDLFEEFETERLILRKITNEDAKDLYENIYNNFEYYKYYYNFPVKDFEEYSKLVEKYDTWYKNGNHFRWGIVLKENNKMIGLIQLHSKDNVNKNCKLAYILGYNYNGHGYMKEAAEKILDFAFDKLDFHRIEAEVVTVNNSSIKLAKSINMEEEKIRCESYLVNEKYYDQKVFVKIKKSSK